MGALGARGGLGIGQVGRHGREGRVLRDRQVLGVGSERALVVAEHVLADRECRDAASDLRDAPGELTSQTPRAGPEQPGEQPHEEGLGGPTGAVGPVDGCGMDLDEHVGDSNGRLVDLDDPDHFRWAVPGVDCSLHTGTVATDHRWRRTCEVRRPAGGIGGRCSGWDLQASAVPCPLIRNDRPRGCVVSWPRGKEGHLMSQKTAPPPVTPRTVPET